MASSVGPGTLDSIMLNPSWMAQTEADLNSTRSRGEKEKGRSILEQVRWDKLDPKPPAGQNILSTLLRESYRKALEDYNSRQKVHVPLTKMTQDVIAALKDPTVKNKTTFISRICEGGRRQPRCSLSRDDNFNKTLNSTELDTTT